MEGIGDRGNKAALSATRMVVVCASSRQQVGCGHGTFEATKEVDVKVACGENVQRYDGLQLERVPGKVDIARLAERKACPVVRGKRCATGRVLVHRVQLACAGELDEPGVSVHRDQTNFTGLVLGGGGGGR